jgi:hypothetical protein
MKTKQKNILGSNYFTMTPKSIVWKFDLTTAYLYGLINSKSNLSSGFCTASQSTLAKEIGISRMSLSRKLNNLVDTKLVTVVSPIEHSNGGVTLRMKCNPKVLSELDIEWLKQVEDEKQVVKETIIEPQEDEKADESFKDELVNYKSTFSTLGYWNKFTDFASKQNISVELDNFTSDNEWESAYSCLQEYLSLIPD